MYALVVASLGAATVLRRRLSEVRDHLTELPPYRMPSALAATVFQRVRTFLVDAGTIILALTVVLWALVLPEDAGVHGEFEGRRRRSHRSATKGAIAGHRTARPTGGQRPARADAAISTVARARTRATRLRLWSGRHHRAFAAREVFVSRSPSSLASARPRTQRSPHGAGTATRPDGSLLMTPPAASRSWCSSSWRANA